MISSAAVVLIAVAVVASPVLVSSMPEHAKRYRNNVNDISQHHALSRSGDTEDPTQEVVIYEETYPYPAEYDQQQDYYPQHYNYQYQQRPGTNPNDRTDNRRVFFGGAALSVLGTATAVGLGMLVAGLGVEGYLLGQLQDEVDGRLEKIRERLETSRADLAVNIDTAVEETVDTRLFVMQSIRNMVDRAQKTVNQLSPAVKTMETDMGRFAGVMSFLCDYAATYLDAPCPAAIVPAGSNLGSNDIEDESTGSGGSEDYYSGEYTGTGSSTGSGTGTAAGTGTDADTGTSTGTDSGSGPGAPSDSGTETGTGTGSGSGPGAPSDSNTDTDAGSSDTGTGTGSGFGTTGSSGGTGNVESTGPSGTGTGTDAETGATDTAAAGSGTTSTGTGSGLGSGFSSEEEEGEDDGDGSDPDGVQLSDIL